MREIRNYGITFAMMVMLIGMSACVSTQEGDDGGLPQRSDIDDKYKWRVEDIYETIDDWNADYKAIEEDLPAFEQYKGKLSKSPEILLACLTLSDSLDIIISDLYVFAFLKKDEDNRVSEYQELGGRAYAINSQLAQAQSFIKPELMEMDESRLRSFFRKNDKLKAYQFYIEDMLRQKAHILSPEEEEIMALAGTFMKSPIDIFQMIDNADHKYGAVLDSSGNPTELNAGRYRKILRGTDREARRIANDTAQASWKRYVNTLATTLNSSLQKDLFITKARKYNSTLERSLEGANIPESVFNNLIVAVNDNIEQLNKLTSLRKKVMGYDTLYTYDMNVPMVPEYTREYPYEEAMELCEKALEPLGKEYVEEVKNGLASHWVDVYETEGKATGGYNWGSFRSHPYIMMNYSDQLDEVFTLAHEFGHAVHKVYTNEAQPYVYAGNYTFIAEVASTVNEVLLMEYMLARAKDKQEKIAIIDKYIESIDGTFFTQAMFSEFENTIHEHVLNGGATSVDYFRKTYRDIFQKYMGPDLVIGPENDMGCLKLYHYYRTYYVFQYSTGYAAAQMIAQRILSGDEELRDKYLEFLTTGRSLYPIDALKMVGVDMTSSEPVSATMNKFGELVDELENLLLEEE